MIPIIGVISHRMNLVRDISGAGGTSIQLLEAHFQEALNDPDCKAIVLDVDSPGGSVPGVPELASQIYAGRRVKPIIAVCNSTACSAAYWLASAAGEIVCTPSGRCGSIGCYVVHVDQSKELEKQGIKVTIISAGKYKTEGNPTEPLSPAAADYIQLQLNDTYRMFVNAVALNRGVSQAAIRDGYGQGRAELASEAVRQGLADRVATLNDVLSELGINPFGATSAQFGARYQDRFEAPEEYTRSASADRPRLRQALDRMKMETGITPSSDHADRPRLRQALDRMKMETGSI